MNGVKACSAWHEDGQGFRDESLTGCRPIPRHEYLTKILPGIRTREAEKPCDYN